MAKFEIKFNKRPIWEGYGSKWKEGKLIIGTFVEKFNIPLNMWTIEHYERQWVEGIQRLETHASSCLVTSIRMLELGLPCLSLWKIYRVGSILYMSPQSFSTDRLKKFKQGNFPAYLETCYDLVQPRVINQQGNAINSEGYELMEWSISVEDFFSSYEKKYNKQK